MTKSSLPLGGYSVNPYVGCPFECKYCYASFMKRFTGHKEPWGKFLDVKYWPEIKNPEKYSGKQVLIGSVTDGYNPYEKKYKRTRKLLEELETSNAKITICTKSDLVKRDLDVLRKMKDVTVSFSINTIDELFRRDMDKASSIECRLTAMKEVYEAGIRTVCFVSPIFPGITDCQCYGATTYFQNLALTIIVQVREDNPVNLFHDSASAKGILSPDPCDLDQQSHKCDCYDGKQNTQNSNTEYIKREDSQHSGQNSHSANDVKDRVGHPASIVFPVGAKADIFLLTMVLVHYISSFFTQVSNSGFLSAVLPYGHTHHFSLPDPLVILLLPRCHQKGQQSYLLRLRYASCGR